MNIKEIIKNKSELSFVEKGDIGCNSEVFIIDENVVLKYAYNPNDPFHYLADMSLSQRNKFSFVPIIERKKIGNDFYYLMKKLNHIKFSLKEKCLLEKINTNSSSLTDEERKENERISLVENLAFQLIELLPTIRFELDLKPDNIMQDENGKIYLVDPISELELD